MMVKFSIDLKDKKKVLILGAIVGVGAIYIYLSFILLPQIARVAVAYSKADKLNSEAKVAQREISEIEGLKKQVIKYRGKIESYESMLPAEQEIPKLLEGLSDMAKSANVKIVAITPIQSKQEAQNNQTYQEIPILINAKSGYHELGKFLNNLENADRFMKVIDIRINENKATPKRHDVEILVLTYKLLGNK
ncbi:MAG: type 4a pilus biogenesis protein PilO [Candidatus Omnitrophota bacterium]